MKKILNDYLLIISPLQFSEESSEVLFGVLNETILIAEDMEKCFDTERVLTDLNYTKENEAKDLLEFKKRKNKERCFDDLQFHLKRNINRLLLL